MEKWVLQMFYVPVLSVWVKNIWETVRMGKGVTFRNMMILVQTTSVARPRLGTQPHYEAPCDIWIEEVSNKMTDIRLMRLFP